MGAGLALETLAQLKPPSAGPPLALALESAPRMTILRCGEIATATAARLAAEGAALVPADSVGDALELMTTTAFDAVTIDPRDVTWFELVRELKGTKHAAWSVRVFRHLFIPIFVTPLPGETEYAVLVAPPKGAWMEDEARVPLANAILWMDVAAMLERAGVDAGVGAGS